MIAVLPSLALAGCGLGGGSTSGPPPAAVNTGLLPTVKRCPPATGSLSGTTLGRVRLGMTRAQAKQAYTQSTDRGTPGEDFFCLTPIGVRVAYPSQSLMQSLPSSEQGQFAGRVIWASSANARFAFAGIRPGGSLAAARKKLHLVGPIQVGANAWYFASGGAATGVFKVRGGQIQEVGIAVAALTGSAQADTTLITSLPTIT